MPLIISYWRGTVVYYSYSRYGDISMTDKIQNSFHASFFVNLSGGNRKGKIKFVMRSFLCLFACGLLFTSCGKEPLNQTPLGNISENTYYQSENDYQTAINSIYSKHVEFITFVNELDAAYLEVNDKTEYLSVKEKTYTGDDPLISRLWDDAYSCLRETHSLLDKIYASPILTNSFKEKSAGQLLTVRGHIYLQLSLWYGKAPLALKIWDPSTDGFIIPESNRNKILDEVIADFEAALFYYANSEYTHMKREQIRQYLIQAYSLKGELSKVASVLKNENVSGNAFYTALNNWLTGEEKGKVIKTYKSTYSTSHDYAGKSLLNTMEYDQTYFGWPDNHLSVFPIPSHEVFTNQGVTQNPGY